MDVLDSFDTADGFRVQLESLGPGCWGVFVYRLKGGVLDRHDRRYWRAWNDHRKALEDYTEQCQVKRGVVLPPRGF